MDYKTLKLQKIKIFKTITAPGMVGHILKRLYSIDIRNGNK
jgi:hypothetical protein